MLPFSQLCSEQLSVWQKMSKSAIWADGPFRLVETPAHMYGVDVSEVNFI